MAISNRIRRSIYEKLEALMGTEEAEAMMDALLQPNWQDVATRDDVRAQISDLRADMHQGFVAQTRWLIGFNTGLTALALTVAKLLF